MSYLGQNNPPAPSDLPMRESGSLAHVSIIIPVFNGAEIIGRLLDSIQQLDYPKDRFEILVVDNNSTDDLERVVAAYPVKLLYERKVQSSYAARNTGIRQAQGSLLAFTDADCLVHPQWLNFLQAAFEDPAVGGAAGTLMGLEPAASWVEATLNRRQHNSFVQPGHPANNAAPKLKSSFEPPSRRLPQLLKRWGLVRYWYDPRLPSLAVAPTANVAYRKEVLEKVGLFDETFIGGGDIEFAIRMQQQSSFKMIAAPQAIVYHRHRSSLRQLWRVFARYEIGHLALIEKYLGLENGIQRQLIVESLAYLAIGIPWSLARLACHALRSVLKRSSQRHDVHDVVVDLVMLASRHLTRLRACRLFHQGRGGELWMP